MIQAIALAESNGWARDIIHQIEPGCSTTEIAVWVI